MAKSAKGRITESRSGCAAMMHQPISGCGPGIGVPADTPRHGTCSIPPTHMAVVARLNREIGIVVNFMNTAKVKDTYFGELARLLQRAADTAAVIARRD